MFSDEINTILLKDGKDWTSEEQLAIDVLVKQGERSNLKAAREILRGQQ